MMQTLLYLLSNAFGIFGMYLLFRLFFGTSDYGGKIVFCCYFAYYSVNSFLYIVFQNPIINFIDSLFALFLLTFLYNSNNVIRFVATFMCFVVSGSIDVGIFVLLSRNGVSFLSQENNNLLISLLVVCVALFLLFVIPNKKSAVQSVKYYPSLIVIPLLSVLLAFFLAIYSKENYMVFAASSVVLVINIALFFIVDIIIQNQTETATQSILKEQNESLKSQLEIMIEASKNINILKHDFINHNAIVCAMIDEGDVENAKRYLGAMSAEVSNIKGTVCGNIVIDSVLNFKSKKAADKGLSIKANITVPDYFGVDQFDLNCILSNLLDNAIENTDIRISPEVTITIAYNKNMLAVEVSNAYAGGVKFLNDLPRTGKANMLEHGFGLQSVKKVVKKYDGELLFETENSCFKTKIYIFCQ